MHSAFVVGRRNLYFLLCVTSFLALVHADRISLDRTRAIIFGNNRTIVITQADLERQPIAGTPRTLENLIFENSVLLQAEELKFNMPEDAVEKHIENIQKRYNMTPDQFEDMLHDGHYTFDLFKQELQRVQMVGNMLEFKVYSKAVVPYQEVVDFYDQHPEYKEPAYQISVATMPKSRMSRLSLENNIAKGNLDVFDWQEPFWIEQTELAQDKMFITQLAVGDIEIVEQRGNYILFRMIEKQERTLVPLDQRYHQIVDILKEPIALKLLEDYKKYIADHTTIIYFD